MKRMGQAAIFGENYQKFLNSNRSIMTLVEIINLKLKGSPRIRKGKVMPLQKQNKTN